MDKQDKPKRKRVKDLQVHEISLVDNPAVPKAKFVIVKRLPSGVEKQAEGIQFVIGRLKGETTTTVQSVLFDKEKWTVARARTWLKDNDFKSGKLDETEERLRFKQRDEGDFKERSFRTIDAGGKGGDLVMVKCENCGEMTKRGEEEYGDQSLPKSGESAMDFLHRVSGQLVSMRRAFPVAIREMLMTLDLALDSTLKQEKPKEEEDEKKVAEEEDEKKAAAEKEATEKAEKEAAEKAQHEEDEKKAAEKVAEEKAKQEKEEAEKGKKAEHQDCPPGMKFDIPSQKCVPMNEEEKKKAAEKAEPEKTEKAFDASLGEIEFSEEDEKGLDNLLS